MRKIKKSRDPVQPERDRVTAAWQRPSSGREDIALLAKSGGVGIELGVDTGQLTRRFLDLGHFEFFYAVDKWDDRAHSGHQYIAVRERLQEYPECRIYRLSAQDFARLVPDAYFDFIYIDCYAHTGQDDGAVLRAMWPKLKPGGLFSGDDYDKGKWPKTVAAVNDFAAEYDLCPEVRDDHLKQHTAAMAKMDASPSWYFYKPHGI